MRLKRFKTLFLACISLIGCTPAGGPVIPVCLSDPIAGGFQCVDREKKPFFVPYGSSNQYIATDLDSFKTLIDWCERKPIAP